jgi:hypothetical protein
MQSAANPHFGIGEATWFGEGGLFIVLLANQTSEQSHLADLIMGFQKLAHGTSVIEGVKFSHNDGRPVSAISDSPQN